MTILHELDIEEGSSTEWTCENYKHNIFNSNSFHNDKNDLPIACSVGGCSLSSPKIDEKDIFQSLTNHTTNRNLISS